MSAADDLLGLALHLPPRNPFVRSDRCRAVTLRRSKKKSDRRRREENKEKTTKTTSMDHPDIAKSTPSLVVEPFCVSSNQHGDSSLPALLLHGINDPISSDKLLEPLPFLQSEIEPRTIEEMVLKYCLDFER